MKKAEAKTNVAKRFEALFTNDFLQNNRSLLREPIELCTSSSRSHRSIIVCWYFLQEHRARSNGQKESLWRWKEISLAPRQRNFLWYNIDNALITILKVTRKNISGKRKLENNGLNGMEYWNNGIELHKRGLKGILLYWKIGKLEFFFCYRWTSTVWLLSMDTDIVSISLYYFRFYFYFLQCLKNIQRNILIRLRVSLIDSWEHSIS